MKISASQTPSATNNSFRTFEEVGTFLSHSPENMNHKNPRCPRMNMAATSVKYPHSKLWVAGLLPSAHVDGPEPVDGDSR